MCDLILSESLWKYVHWSDDKSHETAMFLSNLLIQLSLSMVIHSVPLIQERQLSVSGERMCTNTG